MIKCGFSKGHADVQTLDQEEKEEFSSLEKELLSDVSPSDYTDPQSITIPN